MQNEHLETGGAQGELEMTFNDMDLEFLDSYAAAMETGEQQVLLDAFGVDDPRVFAQNIFVSLYEGYRLDEISDAQNKAIAHMARSVWQKPEPEAEEVHADADASASEETTLELAFLDMLTAAYSDSPEKAIEFMRLFAGGGDPRTLADNIVESLHERGQGHRLDEDYRDHFEIMGWVAGLMCRREADLDVQPSN